MVLWNVVLTLMGVTAPVRYTKNLNIMWRADGEFCGVDYDEECCISSANCKPVNGGGSPIGYPKFCRMAGSTPVFCCMRHHSFDDDYSGEDYYPNKDQFGGKYPPPAFGYVSWNYRPGFGHPPKQPPSNPPAYPPFPQNTGGTNQKFPGNPSNINQGGSYDQFPGYNPSFGATPNRPLQNQPSTFPPILHSNENDAANKQLLDILRNTTNSVNTSPPITSSPLNNNPPQNTNLDVNLNQQGGVDLAAIQAVLGASSPNAAGSIDLSPYVRPTFQSRTFLRKCGEYFRQVQLLKGQHTPVIGGQPAKPRTFLHMALLGYGSPNDIQWKCGGSLISEQWILTAAHCIAARGFGRVQYIRLGELDLNSTTEDAGPRDFTVQDIIVHPLYKVGSVYHDIALLRLNETLTFGTYIRPICLTTVNDLDDLKLVVAGWGLTEYGGAFPSSILLRTVLKNVDIEKCKVVYGTNRNLRQGIIGEIQICADGGKELRDTCNGDSGGPLQYTNYQYNEPGLLGFTEIVGITSFGNGCGLTAGVYTRVAPYVRWIERIVWPNE